MSVAQHGSISTATKKQRKPEPARVVQSYLHEVQAHGKRGALRRTGDLYNISDESVRRYVAADEKRAQVKLVLPDELLYIPAPGEASYLAERDRIAAQLAVEQCKAMTPAPTIRHKRRPECHKTWHTMHRVACGDIMSRRYGFERKPVANVAEMPQSINATRHAIERPQKPAEAVTMPQTAVPPANPAIKRYPPRPAQPGINVSAFIAQVFQPGPMLAVILFVILLGVMYWK